MQQEKTNMIQGDATEPLKGSPTICSHPKGSSSASKDISFNKQNFTCLQPIEHAPAPSPGFFLLHQLSITEY